MACSAGSVRPLLQHIYISFYENVLYDGPMRNNGPNGSPASSVIFLSSYCFCSFLHMLMIWCGLTMAKNSVFQETLGSLHWLWAHQWLWTFGNLCPLGNHSRFGSSNPAHRTLSNFLDVYELQFSLCINTLGMYLPVLVYKFQQMRPGLQSYT